MSPAQALQRTLCQRHPDRVAVVRCPSCGGTFCDECVTEHAGRMVCRVCLEKTEESETTPRRSSGLFRRWTRGVAGTLWCLFAVFALFAVFYLSGRALIRMPSDFHEGTLWESQLVE